MTRKFQEITRNWPLSLFKSSLTFIVLSPLFCLLLSAGLGLTLLMLRATFLAAVQSGGWPLWRGWTIPAPLSRLHSDHVEEAAAEWRAGEHVDQEVGGVGHADHHLGYHPVDRVAHRVLFPSANTNITHYQRLKQSQFSYKQERLLCNLHRQLPPQKTCQKQMK